MPGARKRCGRSRAILGGPSEGSCVWGLTPSMCPPCQASGPSSPVGLVAVEDSLEFWEVFHKVSGEGGEGWQVRESQDVSPGPV